MNFDITCVSMTVLYEIVYMFALLFFFKKVFGAEFSKNFKRYFIGLGIYVCIVGINYVRLCTINSQGKHTYLSVLSLLINLLLLFKASVLLYFIFKKRNITVGFSLFYTVVVYLMSDTVSFIFCETISIVRKELIVILCGTIIQVLLIILLRIYDKKRENKRLPVCLMSLSNKEYILLSAILLFVYIMEREILSSSVSSLVKIGMMVFVLIVVVLIMAIFIIKEKNMSMGNKLIVLEEQMKSSTEYYDELISKYENLRKFRHDIINTLCKLDGILSDAKIEVARDYISDIIEDVKATRMQYNTGCFVADVVLTSKQKSIKEINAKLSVYGIIPEDAVKDSDMVDILSNLLDNAIIACGKIEGEKEIVIDSYLENEKWVFKISYPTSEKQITINDQVLITEDNKYINGTGLLNIKKIVEKYSGNVILLSLDDFLHVKMTFDYYKIKGRKDD